MGGKGRGHKSVRALLSRQANMQKARAARRRPPLPWRSGMESRVIEQLVWQWFLEVRGHRLEVREKYKPWSKVRVARLLGVSHTWVNKLVKRFEADPERMKRKMRAFAPANLDKLERAREETRWERERGRLRGPIRWRRVKVKIQGRERRLGVPTKEEMKRQGRNAVASGVTGETTQQQIPTSASRPHTAGRRRVPFDDAQDRRNDSAFLSYREAPEWAKGLPFAGGVELVTGHGAGVRPPAATRTPKPVPFAFRRKR